MRSQKKGTKAVTEEVYFLKGANMHHLGTNVYQEKHQKIEER